MDAKKYEMIQTQIKDAQKALQHWNERRTEAMIELDSLFTEIDELKQQAIAEKKAHQDVVAQLNAELEKSDREFHRQFEAYTNDFQILKLEKETLQKQLKETNDQLDSLSKGFQKKEKEFESRLSKITQDAELKVADQQFQLKHQVESLISELQSIRQEKNSVTLKAEKYEKELQVIRNQMMSFLNVTQEVSVPRPLVSEASKELAGKLREPEVIVDHVSEAPVSVQDYLKRFGY